MKYGRISIDDALAFAKNQTVLYACAYKVNNENLSVNLMQQPIKGVLIHDPSKNQYETQYIAFAPFDKRNQPRKSGRVDYGARLYADTLEESIELFNEKVNERKRHLEALIQDCNDTFI